jgi:hypothetical protein
MDDQQVTSVSVEVSQPTISCAICLTWLTYTRTQFSLKRITFNTAQASKLVIAANLLVLPTRQAPDTERLLERFALRSSVVVPTFLVLMVLRHGCFLLPSWNLIREETQARLVIPVAAGPSRSHFNHSPPWLSANAHERLLVSQRTNERTSQLRTGQIKISTCCMAAHSHATLARGGEIAASGDDWSHHPARKRRLRRRHRQHGGDDGKSNSKGNSNDLQLNLPARRCRR